MTPGRYDITIYQGADFAVDFTVNLNLTGYSLRSKGRETFDASTAAWSLTSPSSGLALSSTSATSSTIQMRMNAATTAALTTLEGVWDLEIVSGSGAVDRLLMGNWTLSREATK